VDQAPIALLEPDPIAHARLGTGYHAEIDVAERLGLPARPAAVDQNRQRGRLLGAQPRNPGCPAGRGQSLLLVDVLAADELGVDPDPELEDDDESLDDDVLSPLLAGAELAPADEPESELDSLGVDRLSVLYQPLPLKTIPTGWRTRRSSPPHPSWTVSGGSEKLCRTSMCWAQLLQAYS
jgi:hypothetical protein